MPSSSISIHDGLLIRPGLSALSRGSGPDSLNAHIQKLYMLLWLSPLLQVGRTCIEVDVVRSRDGRLHSIHPKHLQVLANDSTLQVGP